MKIRYLATGEELLDGRVSNSNLIYLGQKVQDLGLSLDKAITVGDDPKSIQSVFNDERLECDVLFITGGLGPTDDDRTAQCVSEALGLPLERSDNVVEEMKAFFKKKGRPFRDSNLKQADFPQGASILKNEFGTAPGFHLEKGGTWIVVMPGVPKEMILMFDSQVLPLLKTRIPSAYPLGETLVFRCVGAGESEMANLLDPLYPLAPEITIGYRAKMPEVHITLTVRHHQEQQRQLLMDTIQPKMIELLQTYLHSMENISFMEGIVQTLKRKGLKLALAESCTGGLCANLLTDIPGASDCLDLSCVTYSNDAKTTILQVPDNCILSFGAVSEETSKEMVEGVLAISKATLGLAVTGIAGPGGGSPDKPVGTVYIALKTPEKTTVKRFQFMGDRISIKHRTAYQAFMMLGRYLKGTSTTVASQATSRIMT